MIEHLTLDTFKEKVFDFEKNQEWNDRAFAGIGNGINLGARFDKNGCHAAHGLEQLEQIWLQRKRIVAA